MEEEIKRIEHLIERCNQCKLNACITCDICWSEVQALENLLTRYKEIEADNKRLKDKETEKFLKILDDTSKATLVQETIKLRTQVKDSIPKSKVKEKIEELERDLERDRICIDFVIEHTKDIELKAKIEVLQELLEREGK